MIIKIFIATYIIFSQHVYSDPILKSTIFEHDLIYSDTSRFMNHSASIAVKDSIYYCSWFTAEQEGNVDARIALSKSYNFGLTWAQPEVIFSSDDDIQWRDPLLFMWNDTLRMIFVKIYGSGSGSSADSTDLFYSWLSNESNNWANPQKIVIGKNRPAPPHHSPILINGKLMFRYYWRNEDSNQTHAGVLVASQSLKDWESRGDIYFLGEKLIEPSLTQTETNDIVLYFRTSRGRIYSSFSINNGNNWSVPEQIPIYNPGSLVNFHKTSDSKILGAWNNYSGRNYLSIGVFEESSLLSIEKYEVIDKCDKNIEQVSYPFIDFNSDTILIVYTKARRDSIGRRNGDICFAKYFIDDIEPIGNLAGDNYHFENKATINDILFINDQIGFSINQNNEMYITTNSGAGWHNYLNFDDKLNALHKTNTKIFCVGNNSSLIISEDYGASWSQTGLDSIIDLYAVDDFNDNNIIISGSEGRLIKSHNYGNDWTVLTTGLTQNVIDISWKDQNTIFLITKDSVYSSIDAGINWLHRNDLFIETIFDGIEFFDDLNGIIYGDFGDYFITYDGGDNWTLGNLGINEKINDIEWINLHNIIMVTDQGRLLNLDFMNNTLLFSESSNYLNHFHSVSSLNEQIYFSGWDGKLFNKNLNETSLSFMDENIYNANVKLNLGYPNPFNNYMVINYELSKNEFVEINVYNMLGKIVKNLKNEQQSKGNNRIIWDATNNDNKPVSAGMYIYTLQAGLFYQTEKIIFLK